MHASKKKKKKTFVLNHKGVHPLPYPTVITIAVILESGQRLQYETSDGSSLRDVCLSSGISHRSQLKHMIQASTGIRPVEQFLLLGDVEVSCDLLPLRYCGFTDVRVMNFERLTVFFFPTTEMLATLIVIIFSLHHHCISFRLLPPSQQTAAQVLCI